MNLPDRRRLAVVVSWAATREPARKDEMTMDWTIHIAADPAIMHGMVCFRGTRVPVSVVLDSLADGATPEQILHQYPSLKPEHIPAALAYAADLARERIVPMPA